MPIKVRALDANLILISILSLCFYNVLVKNFPDKLILIFWINLLSYLCFLGIYYFRVSVLNHDPKALHELIFNYTFQDIPLYAIIAASFLGYMIVSEKLLDSYDLSLVIPISQLGILLASAGYILLGDPFNWSLLFGLSILCAGTFVVSLSSISQTPKESFVFRLKNIPKKLVILALIQSLLFVVSSMINYLGTKKTIHTEAIINNLRHLHIGPVAFHSAFYFNIGQQFFSVLIATIYVLVRKKYRRSVMTPIIDKPKYLLMAVLIYVMAEFTYFIAFMITTDTTILLALDNLSIPVILLFSFLILKEELDKDKVIGSSLIVIGGVIAAL